MKMLALAPRNLPLDDSWEVIVIGGGPAGCAAAAAAAREGARTLLIESTGALGGMGTSALVPAWTPFSDRRKVIYRGLAEKIMERCKAGMPHVSPQMRDWVPIDPERLKRIYDDEVTGAGAHVLFNTQLAAVEREGARVDSIVTAGKSGLRAYHARVFIDCTGDADLAAWAGAEFDQGDELTGEVMPATHCFVLANVDEYAYRNGPSIHPNNPRSVIFDILKSGRYPLIPDSHLCGNLIGPRTVGFNAGHLWQVDNTRPETVSAALIQGRRIAEEFRRALAEFAPAAFGNAFLVMTGSLMGIRETRRIVGDYSLTLRDYLDRRGFSDEIARNSYYIDIHWANAEVANEPDKFAQFEASLLRYAPGESHGIPYRCLIPRNLENVLVAGRSISCERIVQGSVRVMPVCLAMGEAAGAAAAAVRRTGKVREVDVAVLRNRLIEHGAWLPGELAEAAVD